MQLDPEFIVRLVHDTIKPVRMLLQTFQMEEATSDEDESPDHPAITKSLEDQVIEAKRLKEKQASRRKLWLKSFSCIEQALMDLQTLASCDLSDRSNWDDESWPGMVTPMVERLRKSHAQTFEWIPPAMDFTGRCDSELIRQVLINMNFFANHFSNRLRSVALKEESQGKRRANLTYVFETVLELGTDFKQIKPFTVMSGESTTIDHNTAIVFYVVERIMHLHGGAIDIQCEGHRVTIHLSFPLAAAQ
jgi:light-regulated signal transduction histidine kinase (bacteriophytochrome)